MTNLNARDVEALKGQGRYAHAGALAAALGMDASYGCHYGMRSTRHAAAAEYTAAHADAELDIRVAAIKAGTHTEGPALLAAVFQPARDDADDAQVMTDYRSGYRR